jgi:hypothetical protein
MRNLYKFIDFIKEELRIDKMNSEDLERIKIDLLKRIDEYKVFILNNIEYDLKTNKIVYKGFEQINGSNIIFLLLILTSKQEWP